MTISWSRTLRISGALGVVAATALGALSFFDEGPPAYTGPVRPVDRGPLTISVSESGTIEAREKVVLKCEVDERSTTITYILPEGTWVEEGELLVELDASVLTDELYDEEIDVLDTEADLLAAEENLEVVKNQAEADTSAAELTLRFAREDLQKYQEGDYPKQLKEATNAVTLAEEQLHQARNKLEWSKELAESGFISDSELEQDRLAFKRAEVDLDLAKTEIELLEQYTHGRQLAQLEADLEQAELALARVRRKAAADLAQAEANLRTQRLQYERQSAQLKEIQTQVEKCRIHAPVAGMVVYATTGRRSWRGNDEPLEVGREVREQEELIHIPVADAKSAQVKVHESSLDKVSPGQEARVVVDALPGRAFHGKVARISPLPDAQSRWLNPDLKVYDTEIHLEGSLEGLRTGMSCRADILVEEYADTLYVPVHAVLRVDGAPTAWVVEEGELVARTIEIGLDNNRMVRVLGGLEAGELVALAPPLQEGEKLERRREDEAEPPEPPVPPEAEGPPRDGGEVSEEGPEGGPETPRAPRGEETARSDP